MEIINEILKWPVIVQGALGSFLFWILFTISQKTISLTTKKFKTEKDLGSFFGKYAKDKFTEEDYNSSNFSFFICIYGALHYLIKFILAAFVGFIVSNFIPVFGYVGFILALYFGFRAISYVTHFDTFDKMDKKAKKDTDKLTKPEKQD
jgi:hypothetical protein